MRIGKEHSAIRLRSIRMLSVVCAVFVGAALVIPRMSAGEETRQQVAKSAQDSGEGGRAGHRLTLRLPPDPRGTSPGEIRGHLANEKILGQFLATKLRSVDGRCSYGFSVDSDFSIMLEALNTSAEDSFSRVCGRQLSNLSRTIEPSEIEFDSTSKVIADAITRANSRQ
jgi:hypothetical protein